MIVQHPPQFEPPKLSFWVWLIFWLLFALIVMIVGGIFSDLYALSQYFDVDPISQAFALHKMELLYQSITKHMVGLTIVFAVFSFFAWLRISKQHE